MNTSHTHWSKSGYKNSSGTWFSCGLCENQCKKRVCMFIKPTTTVFEVKKIISELHGNKHPGHDSFPAKIVKAVSEYICAPLCSMFNLSFVSGCFPDSLQLAKVIPLNKVKINNL